MLGLSLQEMSLSVFLAFSLSVCDNYIFIDQVVSFPDVRLGTRLVSTWRLPGAWLARAGHVMAMELELRIALTRVCRSTQLSIVSYEESKEPGVLDALVYQVHRLYRMVLSVSCSTDVLEAIGTSLTLLQDLNNSQTLRSGFGYEPQIVLEGRRGRPKLGIQQDQLEYLLHLGSSCPKIADTLGVSLSTIRRRMNEFGLCVSELYFRITDQDLDLLVSQIKEEFPNCGYRLMHGHLVHRGHRVSQSRIREALHMVDPEGVAIRWSSAVERRKYSVASPLSLWHLDGNHKLIR